MATPAPRDATRWGAPSIADGLSFTDSRAVHVITRGNVDGIVSSSFCFAVHPDARVSYVPSATSAVELLRKDLSARHFYLIDVGLTPKLIKTLNAKAKSGARVTLIDHHQTSLIHAHELSTEVEVVLGDAGSAAGAALDHFIARGMLAPTAELTRLAAIADIVEYGTSNHLDAAMHAHGFERLEEEAEHLDFAWRLEIEDDRFRANTSRRLAKGLWPSEVSDVKSRYLTMLNENRWLKAQERVRSRLVVRNEVALLHFGKRKPSLLGFGTRALTSVAREEGAKVAVLVNRRGNLASVALRATGDTRMNLGLFVEEFTREHGIVGGGHPTSAGAKINSRSLPLFLDEIFLSA
ncbi:MAG: single-stranded-DNA-specific exonuclease [Thermoplasmata archaeon]|jgi:oligoribonuclease NrnB/cAMP/cGMP phosphodiesterase (DHH superfamily)|nr:single-stranded-DNA-specific exonuclease [Thermoplasmata archaeon]